MFRVLLAFALLVAGASQALAQTATLSGVVVDSAGGVIPGASVVAKHNATGVTTENVSNEEGVFSFPGIQTGAYTVTVSLQGFKTFVSENVVLTTGSTAAVKAVLEVGGITETVNVSSQSEIIQTQSSTVTSTVNINQITKLPTISRDALNFAAFLPGVSAPGGVRDATVNGLPTGFINITLDGVNIQDNNNRSSDGFFAMVSPRLDAIEEVSITTAGQGAAEGGQGAVQIKFVTRSGSNDFTGSVYETYRSDRFNANTWFNNRDGVEKAELTQHQPGARVGGPVVIPGLFDGRNKAFFFVNYEESRTPQEVTRTRTIFHPRAEEGIFRYTGTGGAVQEVNLLQLAAANGQISTIDPTIAAMLAQIRTATGVTGTITDNTNPLVQDYRFNLASDTTNRFPTVRLDYNVTDAHRLSTAWNYQRYSTFPDLTNSREERFPGFPQSGQGSSRWSLSNSLRSTFGNVVNELRVAAAAAPVFFGDEINSSMFANTGGFWLDFPLVTDFMAQPAPQARNAWNVLVEDSVNWLRGAHSLTFGGSFTHYQLWSDASSFVPEIDFDVLAADPAIGLFTSANFPGASTATIANARTMYALLTGRVSGINGDAQLENGKYVYMGNGREEARMRQADLFVQDSWRWKPNFTVNAGLRYSLQFPFTPLNNSYSTATLASVCGKSGVNDSRVNPFGGTEVPCNIFAPGNVQNVTPEYINFGEGVRAYDMDWNNLAPNLGFAWQLGEKNGVLGTLLGDEAVIRGAYSMTHNRAGMGDFTGSYDDNPGIVLSTAPDRNANNLGTLPVLLSQTNRLGPAAFPETPTYPFTGGVRDTVTIFDENVQVPWADSLTFGLQRSLGRNHAIEARYVHTRSRDGWTTLNMNEINIVENGFLDEFKLAMNNLRANQAAGKGNTFAYTGVAGTSPLPIYLAHFQGLPASAANNPANYTASQFSNATFYNPLAFRNPNPFGTGAANTSTASGLLGNATFIANALAAGLPANFWVANPDRLNARWVTNGGKTDYDALQLELRRRLHQGLQFQTSYVFGKGYNSSLLSLRFPRVMRRDTGNPGDLTHAFKANVVYDLPFGRGRKFASNAGPIMERLVGGWSIGMTSRVQSGRLINLGNVRLVGMTQDDVQDLFKLRIDANGDVYMFPQEIIDESVKAFSVSATSANGYSNLGAPSGRYFAPANGEDCIEVANATIGECGSGDLVVTGPLFQQHDLSVSKRVALFGKTNLELRLEALNVFNTVNFIPVAGVGGTTVADYEVTGLTGTTTSRLVQLIGRFNF